MFSGSGSGPGPQTQDGCSVELYRRLPDAQDFDCVAARLKPGMTLLELGCGTGRQTRRLLAWGCEVTAVDNSAEMLAHLPAQAEAVQADITTLALGRRFDRVLLASGLINHADSAVRAALLHTAAQHLVPGGELIVQRQDPRWLEAVETGWVGRVGGAELQAESVHRCGSEVHITLTYRLAATAGVSRSSPSRSTTLCCTPFSLRPVSARRSGSTTPGAGPPRRLPLTEAATPAGASRATGRAGAQP